MKFKTAAVAAISGLALAACSSMNMDKVWPFSGSKADGQPRRLMNATEFQCEAGKHFYLRFADNGASAWLIYPDREVLLTKNGSRYTNGVAVVEQSGDQWSLSDGPTIAYQGCKAARK